MSKEIYGSDNYRWVNSDTRRVYRVKLRENALALWIDEFGEPDPAFKEKDEAFFKRHAGKEIDVYPYDRHPDEDTDFFEVGDDNICLRQSMFETVYPSLPFVGEKVGEGDRT